MHLEAVRTSAAPSRDHTQRDRGQRLSYTACRFPNGNICSSCLCAERTVQRTIFRLLSIAALCEILRQGEGQVLDFVQPPSPSFAHSELQFGPLRRSKTQSTAAAPRRVKSQSGFNLPTWPATRHRNCHRQTSASSASRSLTMSTLHSMPQLCSVCAYVHGKVAFRVLPNIKIQQIIPHGAIG